MEPSMINNMLDKTIPDHFMNVFEAQQLQVTLPEPRRPRYNPYRLETQEKREARLAANRERMRNIRLCETPEQKQARKAYNRIRSRLNLIRETAEERQRRLASNRARMKANREKYSEQRRRMRALETPEMRERRLLANRERNRAARLFETDEQRERRRADNRERQRIKRAQETPEEVEDDTTGTGTLITKHEMMSYPSDAEVDVDLDYVIPDVVINMVDEADSKEKLKQDFTNMRPFSNTITTYNNDMVNTKPMEMFTTRNTLDDLTQPSIGDYIQKCITTIDNILNSDTYQHINIEQQQTITETAMGRRNQHHHNLLPIVMEPINTELPSVIRTAFDIDADKKCSYN